MPITIDTRELERTARSFGILERRFGTITRRILGRAARDLRALFQRHLKEQIRATTRRRTGKLLRARVKSNRRGDTLTLAPDFPATRYVTPAGRGRPGASKIGQYAFVVNHNRDFIRRAGAAMRRDPEFAKIINRHANYILQDEIRKLFPNNLQGKSQ